MSIVIINLAFQVAQYPAGTSTAGTQISLNAPPGAAAIPAQIIAPGATTVTFDNVPDGQGYTASAQLLDGNSQPLGVAVSSTAFDVATPTVGIATPLSVTIAVNS